MKNIKKFFTVTILSILFLNLITIAAKADVSICERYVNYNGVKIYTEAYNYSSKAKEAIIFLHGLGDSHNNGEFLYDESNKYMTITLDYLDHGNSGHASSISWKTQIDSIKAVLDSYGIKKVHLVGHSFGADTAMMFAKKYPKTVEDIVLLDRAYYNYEDFEQFNFTENIVNVLEYNPSSGLTYDEFLQYTNMTWHNDITKTWNIKKDVLLLGASTENYTGEPSTGTSSLAAIISMVKADPLAFGIDPDNAKLLPEFTDNNVSDLVNFLKGKVNDFADANKRFRSMQTSYTHGDMVRDPEAMNAMRNYVLEYLQGKN